MNPILEEAVKRFHVEDYRITPISAHDGGRNEVYVLESAGGDKRILRLSALSDRTEEDFLGETEFVHFLAENGAPVEDVIPSVNGEFVEKIVASNSVRNTFEANIDGYTLKADMDGNSFEADSDGNDLKTVFASLFTFAPGIMISENGYRYREGAPLSEYFYNTGKTLGAIHALSKKYVPRHRRAEYFDKYNREYIGTLFQEALAAQVPIDTEAMKAQNPTLKEMLEAQDPTLPEKLKEAVFSRLPAFEKLPKDADSYGLIHFDFVDVNYHIDMSDGKITVYDFDNSMNCWYLFDLATVWLNGTGWYGHLPRKEREKRMKEYFAKVLQGYRIETEVSEEALEKLPLFIDMVLIENIVDAFECCRRDGEEIDYEEIEDAAESLIQGLPWAGYFEED